MHYLKYILIHNILFLGIHIVECCYGGVSKPPVKKPSAPPSPVGSLDVATDIKNELQQKQKKPDIVADQALPLYVGNVTTFKCQNNQSSSVVIFNQIGHNGQALYTSGTVSMSTMWLTLTLEEFDNGTSLRCTVKSQDGATYSNIYPLLINKSPTSTASTMDEDVWNVNFDNDKEIVTYDCSSQNELAKVIHIQENKIKRIYDTKSIQEHFTKNDSNSILLCYFVYTKNNELGCLIRRLDDKVRIVNAVTSPQTQEGIIEYYYIGGATVGTIILIIIIVLLSIKRFRNKPTTVSEPSEENRVEYINSTLLYANLNINPLARSRDSEAEESPYAQIIYPETVTYAQLDLPNNNRTIHKEESPYAQIVSYPRT